MIFVNYDSPALVLTTKALESVFDKLDRIKALHVTDIDGLKGLKKIQGQAISQSHDSKYVPVRFHLVAVVIVSTPFILFWRLG